MNMSCREGGKQHARTRLDGNFSATHGVLEGYCRVIFLDRSKLANLVTLCWRFYTRVAMRANKSVAKSSGGILLTARLPSGVERMRCASPQAMAIDIVAIFRLIV